jgi:hypothetical protein
MKKYGMNWIVTTRDVDGSSKRKYATAKGAKARFEEMLGYPIENAVWDMLPEMDDYPEWTSLPFIKGVSNYGCVVSIEWESVDDFGDEDRANAALSSDHYRGP